jgi:c-di-GMP-binding flagellar brake protein YcgR
LHTALEVRHRLPVQLRNGQDALRVGCSFLRIPTHMENLIQRYVGQLERERRATMR